MKWKLESSSAIPEKEWTGECGVPTIPDVGVCVVCCIPTSPDVGVAAAPPARAARALRRLLDGQVRKQAGMGCVLRLGHMPPHGATAPRAQGA